MVDTLSLDSYVAGTKGLDGLPIDEDTMFSDHKGVHKPRIEKKQRKLLAKVDFLQEFLEDGEQVLTVTTAVSPTSFLEQWTTGFIFLYIRRCLLVFTDRRIFHVPTTMSYDYRQSVAQIRYGDVESIAQKGSRLKIAYKSGDKELFLYLRRSERKKIRLLLEAANLQGETSSIGKRVHLCPQCTSELEVDRFDCASCGKEFRSRTKARNLSIWLPGGGYFFTGHPYLGVVDAVIELLFLFIIVTALIPTSAFPDGDLVTAGVFAVLLIFEKLITVYHANHFVKEYLPVDRVPIRRSPVRMVLGAIGLVIVLGILALGILGVLMDTGHVPSERVLSSQEIPDNQYHALVAEGIVEPDESIEFFYSEGLLSVTEAGSVLTDRRVIAYEQDEEGRIQTYYILNDSIQSVTLVQQGDATQYSVYQVTAPGEDNWLYLVLPHENGDGERFANAVRNKIRE
ncbi:MAG: hypothetical protein QNJ19_15715 [Woeseiaceae bacterium]|nr:hypothetical protein [Woeseiaceae bacterium]